MSISASIMDDSLFAAVDPSTQELTETETREETGEQIQSPWKLILYDDDVHTFDDVINQLIKALRCNKNKAEELTWKVHHEGKAIVYEGDFEECLRIDAVLKEIQLITEIKG